MKSTGQTVTLKVAKRAALYHGLGTLLDQPSPQVQQHSGMESIVCSVLFCFAVGMWRIHRVPKKPSPLMFDNNFGKCEPIFKILSPGDSWENSLCTRHKDFYLTCNMLLQYLLKVKNPKNVTDFDSTSTECWCIPVNTLRTWFNI